MCLRLEPELEPVVELEQEPEQEPGSEDFAIAPNQTQKGYQLGRGPVRDW
jgi:hypothetical protein